jgi:lysophospholipase L1-like esterase
MNILNYLLLFFVFSLNPWLIIQAQIPKKQNFYFGTSEKGISEHDTFIKSQIFYNEGNKYGFDLQSANEISFKKKSIISQNPFYFSVRLPEGNYTIEVDLGTETRTSLTTIKAESRRFMRCQIAVKKGGIKTEKFNVNLRGIKITPTESIKLKSREKDDLNWDQKLSLEFSGGVAIRAIRIKPAKDYTNIFLAGDSTVTDQDLAPWASWGQLITQYFSPEIVVSNYAASGESLGSFKARNRFEKILHQMQEGDYLFIEFGHNDEKIKGEGNGAYGLYTQLLKDYIKAAHLKGGIPVLLTPTQRRHFDDNGKLIPTHGDFPDAMQKVAKELEVPLIDLTAITTKMYENWGVESSKDALVHYPANTFPGQEESLADNTHFNVFGANEIALAIIEEIRNSNLELKNYIRKDVPRYNAKKPNHVSDWTVPVSLRFDNIKPEGN